MKPKLVTATRFRQQAGRYLDEAAKAPVIITRHGRYSRVLIDFEEYERYRKYDTRQALYPEELTGDLAEVLDGDYQGEPTPDLDHLDE